MTNPFGSGGGYGPDPFRPQAGGASPPQQYGQGPQPVPSPQQQYPPQSYSPPGYAPQYSQQSYGQPASQPGDPRMPVPTRPVVVWLAVVALVVAAAGCIAQMVVAVLAASTRTREIIGTDDEGTHYTDHYQAFAGWVVVLLAVIAVLFAIGYCALAFFVWRGVEWPRYVVTGLTLFSLFGLLGGLWILVVVISGALAAILLWTPAAHDYCAALRLRKAPIASNPFGPPSGPPPGANPWQ